VLLQSGAFLKGNLFFKDYVTEEKKDVDLSENKEESQEEADEADEKMQDPEDNDAYAKMKNQLQRYYE